MDPKSRSFLGAIAAAIKAFCLLFINAVGVAQDGVAMADKAVKHARRRQAIDLAVSMAEYAQKAREAAAYAQVKQELQMREFIGADEERAALIDQARAKIDAVIAKELAEVNATSEV